MRRYHFSSRCMKCGADRASTKYVNFSSTDATGAYITMYRMERTCGLCGFTWWELPQDSAEVADEISEEEDEEE